MHHAARRYLLSDGMRVVLYPDSSVPALGVALHRGAGFRDDPTGRAGLAHLVEHLVHEGSTELGKKTHAEWIAASGGTANAATHQDHTVFHQTVSTAALERTIYLEAARSRTPRIDERSVRTQAEVVGEEIRSVVLGHPYGGFPWMSLPSSLYKGFPCSHNGYGDPSDLLDSTVEECLQFVEQHYRPTNSVLTLVGDFHAEDALEMLHRHFGTTGHVSAQAEPDRPPRHRDEPRPATIREARARIPYPALALAAETPDPLHGFDAYLRWVLLSLVLGEGPVARLRHRLVREERAAFNVAVGCGLFGTALETRGPDALVITTVHQPGFDRDRIVAIIDGELERMVGDPPGEEEIASAVSRFETRFHREHDPAGTRAQTLGRGELHFADPMLPFTLPSLLQALGPDDVARAAGELLSAPRGELILTPSGSGNRGGSGRGLRPAGEGDGR